MADEDTEPPNELAEYTLLQQVIIRSSRIHHSQSDCVFELMAMDSLHNGELMAKLEMNKDGASFRKAVATINKLCETKYPVTCSNVVKNKGLSGSKATALIEKCEAALDIEYTRGQEKTLFKQFEHFSIHERAQNDIRHDRCRAKLTGDPLRRYQLRTGPNTPYEYTPFKDLYQAGKNVLFKCSGHKTRAQNLNEKRLLTAYLIFGDLNKTVKKILFENNESIDPTITNNEGGAKCSLLGDDIGQNYNNNHVTETPPDTLDFNQWEARKLCNTTDDAEGKGDCMNNILRHCYTTKDESLGVERWPAPPDPDAEPPLFR